MGVGLRWESWMGLGLFGGCQEARLLVDSQGLRCLRDICMEPRCGYQPNKIILRRYCAGFISFEVRDGEER